MHVRWGGGTYSICGVFKNHFEGFLPCKNFHTLLHLVKQLYFPVRLENVLVCVVVLKMVLEFLVAVPLDLHGLVYHDAYIR